MPSLTRIEAAARRRLLSVEHYDVGLDVTESSSRFRSTTSIRFAVPALESPDSAASQPESTFVDVKADTLISAFLNGQSVPLSSWEEGRLALPGALLAAHNVLVVDTWMSYSSDGEGLHRHVDPSDGRAYLYAMSFLDAGPRWFSCFDQPDLKATYSLRVRCPAEWTVLGNGAARRAALDSGFELSGESGAAGGAGAGDEAGAAAKSLAADSGAAAEWVLADTPPLSTYQVTLVAGPYVSVLAEHDGIALGVHAPASRRVELERDSAELLELTANAFDRYHGLFDIRYPFGEYHQCFVPDFNAGAMENPGCVTIRDQYLFRSRASTTERTQRAATIVHELAHMWFGNLVTMRWWDDLWLNESFAEYLAYRVLTDITDYPAWMNFGLQRKAWGLVADQSPSTHPVAGNGSADAAGALADFDGISYAKGAVVLGQLAEYVGDKVFFAGLNAYFEKYRFGNAEFAELIAAWTAAGAVGLGPWSDAWLRTSGLDTLTGSQRNGLLTVTRATPTPPSAAIDRGSPDRVHRISVLALDDSGSPLTSVPVLVSDPVNDTGIAVPAQTALLIADAGDRSWAKIRFDSWAAVGQVLPGLAAGPVRVVVLNAIRDAARDGELPTAQAMELLLHAAETEDSPAALDVELRFCGGLLAAAYSDPGQRPARRRRVAEIALGVLQRAEPGSDLQLESARSLIRFGWGVEGWPGHMAWLSRPSEVDGLSIDSELRWLIVRSLAEAGALDPDLLDEELRRDPSASGQVHAAFIRAATPTAEAKSVAWAALTCPSDSSAYELYAIAEGFFRPEQTALTSEYAQNYAAAMVATAEFRGGWALSRVISLGFPTSDPDSSVAAAARAATDREGVPDPVRRALRDGIDELERAHRQLARISPPPA